MILDVSPTRMELLKLKKKLSIARRGHKLLKDKLDEFVRIILILVKEVSELRELLDNRFSEASKFMGFAGYITFPEALRTALAASNRELAVNVSLKQLLNLKVPEFRVEEKGSSERSYGFAQTSAGLDYSLELFNEAIMGIVELSQKEKRIEMVAEEIQKTRRRVNALEYILIPNIEETIRYISMKLEEQERNTLTQLMRIKDVVRAPVAHTSAYAGVVRLSP